MGRYIQSDPIGILRDYSAPQMQVALLMGIPLQSPGYGLNHLYGYVEQNPLFWKDPFGLGQTTDLGGGNKVRVDKPHVPGQQKHAHFESPKGKGVVNQDGSQSHKSKGSLDNMNKKIKNYLKKKGFKLGCLVCAFIPDYEEQYCAQNPWMCYEVPPDC